MGRCYALVWPILQPCMAGCYSLVWLPVGVLRGPMNGPYIVRCWCQCSRLSGLALLNVRPCTAECQALHGWVTGLAWLSQTLCVHVLNIAWLCVGLCMAGHSQLCVCLHEVWYARKENVVELCVVMMPLTWVLEGQWKWSGQLKIIKVNWC